MSKATNPFYHNFWKKVKKSPENLQETMTSNSEQNKKERTYSRMGSLQPEAEGSPTPEVAKATSFERSVTSRPTISSRSLHFSITDGLKSRNNFQPFG